MIKSKKGGVDDWTSTLIAFVLVGMAVLLLIVSNSEEKYSQQIEFQNKLTNLHATDNMLFFLQKEETGKSNTQLLQTLAEDTSNKDLLDKIQMKIMTFFDPNYKKSDFGPVFAIAVQGERPFKITYGDLVESKKITEIYLPLVEKYYKAYITLNKINPRGMLIDGAKE
jgi:hypothetical protein